MNKKKQNKFRQMREQIDKQNLYMPIFNNFDNDQLDYILYQLLKYPKAGIGYQQVEGEIIEWVELLNLHREWHQLRCSRIPDNEDDKIIREEGLKEASIVFREDIDDWMERNFQEHGKFDLYYTLNKHLDLITNQESINILFFFIKKIAKKINSEIFNHPFVNLFSIKFGDIK